MSQEEPGGARGARRSQEEPGGARKSQEEPGGASRSQEEPGGARWSQGLPGASQKPSQALNSLENLQRPLNAFIRRS